MKTVSKFDKFSAVSKGSKVVKDVRPEIITDSMFNKISINGSASRLMGLRHGDAVQIFVDNTGSCKDLNDRFMIAVTTPDKGAKLASNGKKVADGMRLGFSYAGVWSQMIQDDPNAEATSEAVLVDKGLMVEVPTQKNKNGEQCYNNLATVRVGFVPTLVGEDVTIAGETYAKVWALVDRKVYANDLKKADEELVEE